MWRNLLAVPSPFRGASFDVSCDEKTMRRCGCSGVSFCSATSSRSARPAERSASSTRDLKMGWPKEVTKRGSPKGCTNSFFFFCTECVIYKVFFDEKGFSSKKFFFHMAGFCLWRVPLWASFRPDLFRARPLQARRGRRGGAKKGG